MTTADAPFHAVLFPHRSLSRRGYMLLMLAVAGALGFGAARALAIGAWPVSIFAMVDVLLVWGAFKLSYRSGRQFEEVSVSRDEVLVRQVAPSGRVTEHRFNPLFARLSITRHAEAGITCLALAAQGHRVVIGAFLNPDDKATFARAFSDALARAR